MLFLLFLFLKMPASAVTAAHITTVCRVEVVDAMAGTVYLHLTLLDAHLVSKCKDTGLACGQQLAALACSQSDLAACDATRKGWGPYHTGGWRDQDSFLFYLFI